MSNGFLLLGVHAGVVYATEGGGGASYTLTKYQFFNDDGEFPGVTTTSSIPVSFSESDTLNSGNNTASSVWFVSTQGVSTNDLVIWHIGWDDSTTVSACTASTAPSGQQLSTLISPVASANTEVRSAVYWAIATTSWAQSTTRFTPSATESWTATVLRIQAGSFNSTAPFGALSTYNANASTSASVSSPSFSATTTDFIGRLVAFNTIDTDPITAVPAGWQSTNALDLGAVTHGLSYRTSTVASAESIPSYTWTIAGDSSVTHAYILRAYSSTVDLGRSAVTSVNSSATLTAGTNYGVQARVENSVSSGVSTFKWQYLHSEGASTWTNITDSSAIVYAVTTSYFSHGDDVPEYLTGSGTYATNNNAGLTSSGAWSLAANLASDGAYESHLNFNISTGTVSTSDTIHLRIALGDGTALDTYSFTPTVTVSTTGGGGNVAFDNANSTSGTGVASLTTSAWTIAGSNRVLVAGLAWGGASPPAYSDIKWEGSGGASLTQQGTTYAPDSFDRMAIATLIAPNAASGTLYGELAGTEDTVFLGGISFTDANQTTPLGTQVRNTASAAASPATATASSVGGADEDMFVSFAMAAPYSGANSAMTVAVGADQTMRWEEENVGPSYLLAATMSTEPGSTSATLTEVFSCTGDTINWHIIGVAVKAA